MTTVRYRIAIAILSPIAFFSIVLGILAMVWALNPSSKWVEPRFYNFNTDTNEVTFIRTVRNPPQTAVWTHEIITASGLQCSISGRTFYERADRDTARFPVPAALLPCLTGEPRTSRLEWQVLAFGIIPLRPVTLTQQFEGAP